MTSPQTFPPYYRFCPMCATSYGINAEPEEAYHCAHCGYQIFLNLIATGSALVMRNNHQEILLVQRAIDPKKDYWDIPGGFCNATEHPRETAQRELQEELGVHIAIEKLWNVYAPVPYEYQNKTQHDCDVFFLAAIESGTPTPADDVAAYKWFSLNELPEKSEIAFPSAQQALQELKAEFLHA